MGGLELALVAVLVKMATDVAKWLTPATLSDIEQKVAAYILALVAVLLTHLNVPAALQMPIEGWAGMIITSLTVWAGATLVHWLAKLINKYSKTAAK